MMGIQKDWGFHSNRRAVGSSTFFAGNTSNQLGVSACGDPNTLFIDNLPNGAEIPWFRKFFSSYGKVIEAFIPNKRSMKTGNKFGFIRYNNYRSAVNAIAQVSGLRIGRRNLIVKQASYGKRNQRLGNDKAWPVSNRFTPLQKTQILPEVNRNMSSRKRDSTQFKELENRVTIYLQPTASEWLWRSAIAELKDVSTPEIIQNAFSELKFKNIQVRSMGGKFMIITFQNSEDRNKALVNQVIKGWFQSFKHWNGDAASLSRIVWLKVRGMPLNAWELKSFKKIAESWGEFLTLDQETLSMDAFDVGRLLITTSCKYKIDEWINVVVKGKNYRVQVWEEECNDPFDVNGDKHKTHQFSSNIVPQSSPVNDKVSLLEKLNKDSDEGESSKVKKNTDEMGIHRELSEKNDEVAHDDTQGENPLVVNEIVANGVIIHELGSSETVGAHCPKPTRNPLGTDALECQQSPHVVEVLETPFQSLKDNQVNNQALIVHGASQNLSTPHVEHINDIGSEFNQLPAFIVPKVVRAKKRKELRALCDTLEEFDRISVLSQKNSNSNHSDSISCGDIAKRNEVILRELKDAIEVNKSLNVKFHESDEVTLNRLLQLEVEELNRRHQANLC
ncbi:hypothetical protein Vadar_033471 [Vaccinium darrowii]|uniref:Uncharacterized protein n=1 Tax=Vaccinium darrowii TaxID=229202 RepID=A0ACB7YBK8_9ERIC|nr:hypothetical protein Vadar_033471 [Vaccinium darrowii]